MTSTTPTRTLRSSAATCANYMAVAGWALVLIVLVSALWPQFGRQAERYSVSAVSKISEEIASFSN